MSTTKIEFRMLTEAEAAAAAAAQPNDPSMCKCKRPTGKPFNVTLEIDSGSVNAVLCAVCELPCVINDDLELLEGVSVPARLTITVETHSNPIVGTETNVYLLLDEQPYEASE